MASAPIRLNQTPASGNSNPPDQFPVGGSIMENTSENLEHIEHNQHAAHASHFDRRVAVSMAIIAALLATVTLLSHRAHNATLRFQSEANIFQTKASDEWNYYQAKNNRDHAY